LENIPGKHSIDSLQKTAILGTSHIIRKVLQCEAWSLSGGDQRWFKRSTRKKCLWQETCILYNNNNKPGLVSCDQLFNQEAGPSRESIRLLSPVPIGSRPSISQGIGQLTCRTRTGIRSTGSRVTTTTDFCSSSQNVGLHSVQAPDAAASPINVY